MEKVVAVLVAVRSRCACNQRGQTMVEYVLITAIMVLSLSILAMLMYVFKEQSARVLDLVSSEYP